MVWHILGWVTVASQVGVGGYVLRYLIDAGRESRTWLRRLPVPKISEAPFTLNSGSDYVGHV